MFPIIRFIFFLIVISVIATIIVKYIMIWVAKVFLKDSQHFKKKVKDSKIKKDYKKLIK